MKDDRGFHELEDINESRKCRICGDFIVDEPGIVFRSWLINRGAGIFFHKKCLLESLKNLKK